jgi:mRNA-degrading endonuclease RelE of RelBE toxin-antitoxin system
MFQINFTDVSSAEMALLPKMLQIEILSEFQVLTPDFITEHPDRFGVLTREDRSLYRYRATDYRIYFEKSVTGLLIHRVLHKNTMRDFLFRTNLPVAEDEVLQDHPGFWELIDSPEAPKPSDDE